MPRESAYVGTLRDDKGLFIAYKIEPSEEHIKKGYWRFGIEGDDDIKASSLDFSTPEEVLKAASNGQGRHSNIQLRWVPGEEDSHKMIRLGTAREHLQNICVERSILGHRQSSRGQVPYYHIDNTTTLANYRSINTPTRQRNGEIVSKIPTLFEESVYQDAPDFPAASNPQSPYVPNARSVSPAPNIQSSLVHVRGQPRAFTSSLRSTLYEPSHQSKRNSKSNSIPSKWNFATHQAGRSRNAPSSFNPHFDLSRPETLPVPAPDTYRTDNLIIREPRINDSKPKKLSVSAPKRLGKDNSIPKPRWDISRPETLPVPVVDIYRTDNIRIPEGHIIDTRVSRAPSATAPGVTPSSTLTPHPVEGSPSLNTNQPHSASSEILPETSALEESEEEIFEYESGVPEMTQSPASSVPGAHLEKPLPISTRESEQTVATTYTPMQQIQPNSSPDASTAFFERVLPLSEEVPCIDCGGTQTHTPDCFIDSIKPMHPTPRQVGALADTVLDGVIGQLQTPKDYPVRDLSPLTPGLVDDMTAEMVEIQDNEQRCRSLDFLSEHFDADFIVSDPFVYPNGEISSTMFDHEWDKEEDNAGKEDRMDIGGEKRNGRADT